MQEGTSGRVTLFLAGDVMTGRGIDQILPNPSSPELFEPCVASAREYVGLAERAHGQITQPVQFAYPWGDVLPILERLRPAVRIVNLETAVTTSNHAWPGKGIHYRMQPRNAPCLTALGINCCSLANNHSMDWGRPGLNESLSVLHTAGIRTAGAGMSAAEACAPARCALASGGNLLLFACGTPDSGVAADWAAGPDRSGVCLLRELSSDAVTAIAGRVQAHKRPGDIVVLSVHWGGNWGYEVPEAQRHFARQLIRHAAVDIVHGHSSHHPRGIEVCDGKLVLYGCGDFLNDYEGISGYESYRGDLGLMYFPTVDFATGQLVQLRMVATRIQRLRVNVASRDEGSWLCGVLAREGRRLGSSVEHLSDGTLTLRWRDNDHSHDTESVR